MLCKSQEEIEKTINKFLKKGEAVPLLLWLYKEKE